MNHENFNPLDERYEQVEDLPEAERTKYTDTPEGGFVLSSAMENYDKWAKRAKEANDGRSLWKKVLMMNRSSALGFAQAEANQISQRGEVTEQFIEDTFIHILHENKNELQELIDGHLIDSIISEDYSGRFPAEILQKTINTIYLQRNQSEVPLVPLHSSRGMKQKEVDETAQKIIASESLGRGALYVTDFVASGRSSERAFKALGKAIYDRKEQGLESPEFVAFITLGSWDDYNFPGSSDQFTLRKFDRIQSELEKLRSKTHKDDIDEAHIAEYERMLSELAQESEEILKHGLWPRVVFRGGEEDNHGAMELFSATHNPSGLKENKELSQGLREYLIAKLGRKFADLYLKETT